MNSAVHKARNILSLFPKDYFNYCFCYGSGVFKQTGKTKKPMIDFTFVVNDATKFHADNVCKHSWHYSAIKYLGYQSIVKLQEQWGAKIYYNTLIYHREEDVTYKYGVISRDDFIADLLDWCDLYIAGRLHKPVAVLYESRDTELLQAVQFNLCSAVHIALLTLPEEFSEVELYQTIANISYLGDFRMWFGEDKNKVKNIVLPQIEYFRELYSDITKSFSEFLHIPESTVSTRCRQSLSPKARWHHLNNLPTYPLRKLVKHFNKLGHARRDTEEVLQIICHDPDVGQILSKCLEETVFKSSLTQSLKGVITAGILKSIRYGGRKIYKSFRN